MTIAELEILYLDNHLIAINKPYGLATQSESEEDPSLLEYTRDWLKKEFNKPGNVYLGLVHRLDQPVAGVVLFARTSKAASRLSEQFRERTTQKVYKALVENKMEQPNGILIGYLKKEKKSLRATVFPRSSPDAKVAELSYRVLKVYEKERLDTCLLEVRPVTGRFHQIRAQLAAIKHPIIGDVKYGARYPLMPDRQIALYASQLIFNHPISGEGITIEAPEPSGWPFVPA